MNLQQLNQRVQTEADARFGETIEHLLFILDYEEKCRQVVRRCYCDQINHGKSFGEELDPDWKTCENCNDR